LVDDGGDDVEDFLLLTTRELLHFVEEAAGLASWCAASERCVHIEQILDADAEGVGEFGKHVGPRRLFGALPEGDIGLGLADEASELSLA
jgi:hypothetical protein